MLNSANYLDLMEAAADLYFDKYGNVNVLDLDWREIKFYNKNMRRHIQGFHLNKLLHGLFILFGYKTPRGSDLPGGVLCWEEIVEPVYVSLVMICSAECVLARVSFVLDLWRRCKETYVGNIAYGALSFLLLWVSRFNVYIADELLIYIKGGVNSLDRLLGGSCCTDESFQDALVEDCHKKCIARLSELQEVVQKVCSDRSAIASGIYRVLKRLDNETTSDGQVKQSPYYNVKDHSNVLFPEDTAAIEGSWTGFEQAQLEEQRRLELNQLASAPKLQLDLFGADTFLDSEDEDSLNRSASFSLIRN